MTRSGKPVIPVLRHLARTGGTLITKCIGSMDKCVVLSEVHPGNLAMTNPMRQAFEWFGLVSQKQLSQWKRTKGPSFEQFVWVCDNAAQARGDRLILRDWSHLDYHGAPFVEPSMGSGVRDSIAAVFDVAEAYTVRHPIDSYLSLMKLPMVRDALSFEAYNAGCASFAVDAEAAGFVRYEDFTHDPDAALKVICDRLGIVYDAGYRSRWSAYTTVTGDTRKEVGRATAKSEITPLGRREIDPELQDRFRADPAYLRTCELLGYEP